MDDRAQLIEAMIGAMVSIARLDEDIEDAERLLPPERLGNRATLAAARSHLERCAVEVHSLLTRALEEAAAEPPSESSPRPEGPRQ